MILCSADQPGEDGSGLYFMPYCEAVDGYRHAYEDAKGRVKWTRKAVHPPDPRCPECASIRQAVKA